MAPSNASVPVVVGIVIVPLFDMDEITGLVSVLLVNVCDAASVTTVSVVAGKVKV